MGVFGYNSASTGTTMGVRGDSASASGIGVYGYASNASGTTSGVRGQAASANGFGVYGYHAGSGTAVYANAPNGHALLAIGNYYGVLGGAPMAGHAVYAQGDLTATGTKAFRIDHPSDPTNKYLYHYATESPTPQNSYSGNVVTDQRGYAWVTLPDYFAEVNANFKYQLTVLSGGEDFVQAMVSREIAGNRFQVRTSAPNTKVSWRIEADRNDLYVRKKGPRDVVDKPENERGTYQHPELYDAPEEMGLLESITGANRSSERTKPN
jgi:hypothetical protein